MNMYQHIIFANKKIASKHIIYIVVPHFCYVDLLLRPVKSTVLHFRLDNIYWGWDGVID